MGEFGFDLGAACGTTYFGKLFSDSLRDASDVFIQSRVAALPDWDRVIHLALMEELWAAKFEQSGQGDGGLGQCTGAHLADRLDECIESGGKTFRLCSAHG